MNRFLGFAAAASVSLFTVSACDDGNQGTTQLNPEGPPMVRQVFMQERVTNPDDTISVRTGMAFGDHPDFSLEEDDRQVDAAIVSTNVPIRIVMDELLVGNNIEELACTDGTFSPVPLDADPDDIADCAPANLDSGNCTALCAANGGIKDENEDGAPDIDGGRRMISVADGVLTTALTCDGVNIPLDATASFYSPAGNQQITAGPLGINSLGPALVLIPTAGMRTGSRCSISFDASVVDKDGTQVCAPPNGDITMNCTPGDTSLLEFGTEVLALGQSDPGQGGVNVPVTTGVTPDKSFTLLFNADISMETLATGFVLTPTPAGAVTAMLNENDASNVTLVVAGGLEGNTDYTLTISPTLTDIYGGALPQETTLSFSTGAGAIIDAGIDAAAL